MCPDNTRTKEVSGIRAANKQPEKNRIGNHHDFSTVKVLADLVFINREP